MGDSIAGSAAEEARPLIWSNFSLSWDTVGSTGWPAWTAPAQTVVAKSPLVVVVALGTNHLWDGWSRQDVRELSTFLYALGSPACTVLVGYASSGHVRDLFGRENSDYGPAEVLANQALRAQARDRTTLGRPTTWADWAPHTGSATFESDGVHLSQSGQDAWATWVSSMINDVASSGSCKA